MYDANGEKFQANLFVAYKNKKNIQKRKYKYKSSSGVFLKFYFILLAKQTTVICWEKI